MSTMTASASATERDIADRPSGKCSYAASEPAAESYVFETRPAFELEPIATETGWAVRDVETGIYGAGETPSEALLDFQRAVLEHLDMLQRQESLSDDLLAQLQYLQARAE